MALKDLTKKEIEEKGHELATLVRQLEQLQAKHGEKKKAMKAAETDIEVQIAELAMEVETGKMEIDDQVDAFEDKPKKKTKLAAVDDVSEDAEKH